MVDNSSALLGSGRLPVHCSCTYVKKGPVGTEEMAAISEAIHGGNGFLKREYDFTRFVVAVLLCFSPS